MTPKQIRELKKFVRDAPGLRIGCGLTMLFAVPDAKGPDSYTEMRLPEVLDYLKAQYELSDEQVQYIYTEMMDCCLEGQQRLLAVLSSGFIHFVHDAVQLSLPQHVN